MQEDCGDDMDCAGFPGNQLCTCSHGFVGRLEGSCGELCVTGGRCCYSHVAVMSIIKIIKISNKHYLTHNNSDLRRLFFWCRLLSTFVKINDVAFRRTCSSVDFVHRFFDWPSSCICLYSLI